MNIQRLELTDNDARDLMDYAREAARVAVCEDQRMDVGSVRDLFHKRGDVLVEITSAIDNRVRGKYLIISDDNSIAQSIIEGISRSVSRKESIGGEITDSDLDNIIIKIAPVVSIRWVDDVNDISVGTDMPLVGDGWMFPDYPVDRSWSKQEYLRKTCRIAGEDEIDSFIVIETTPIIEKSPKGGISILRD